MDSKKPQNDSLHKGSHVNASSSFENNTVEPNNNASEFGAGAYIPNDFSEMTRVRKKKNKNNKVLKRVLIVVAIVLLIVIIGVVAFAIYLNSLNSSMSYSNEEKQKLEAVTTTTSNQDDPFYMLVLGSDARDSDSGSRTDVMILLRVDPKSGAITMVSIPRDTKIEIEGQGTQKINAAYAYGGSAGAVSAVSKFAGVPISRCAVIHFDELKQLVDDLGGIWVDVPVSNDQTGSSNTGATLKAGYQLLNGEQALSLARERYGYTRGDFQRADNQKLIATAIIKKVLEQPATQLPATIQKLAQCVTVNYSVSDIVSLAQKLQKTGVKFYSATVPSTTETIDGVSYTITVEDKWKEMMELVKQGKDPSVITTTETDSSQNTENESTDNNSAEANAETNTEASANAETGDNTNNANANTTNNTNNNSEEGAQ